jgi:hypothetical protein
VDEARPEHDQQESEMKIISGWKDYYDHVAHMYGGGDPKVIYKRDYVVPDQVAGGMSHEDTLTIRNVWTPSIPHSLEVISQGIAPTQKIQFNALVVMDRVFILERQCDTLELGGLVVRKDWHITARPILDLPYGGLYALMRPGEALTENERKYERNRMQDLMNDPKNDRLLFRQGSKYYGARELCEFVGAPVFVIHGHRPSVAMGRTPKLSALGLPAFIEPQQLYQELAMFVGNVLKPVEQPPSNMQDIEKVVSHGFDKKVSFRHRK